MFGSEAVNDGLRALLHAKNSESRKILNADEDPDKAKHSRMCDATIAKHIMQPCLNLTKISNCNGTRFFLLLLGLFCC